MEEDDLQRIYQWIDEIPLSRPKRNISRDFADGVLVAEVVAHYYPKMVELHNYPSANSFSQKMYNWQTLSKKVFKKIGLGMHKAEMEALSNAEPQAVEQLLKRLQVQLARYNLRKQQQRQQQQQLGLGSPGTGDEAGASPPPPHHHQFALPARPADGGAATDSRLRPAPRAPPPPAEGGSIDVQRLLSEKDQTIDELNETVEILEVKIKKLEQLTRLKDTKIQKLTALLEQHGHIAPQG